MESDRTREREPEPEPNTHYDQVMEYFEEVRDRVTNPLVVRGDEQPWQATRQGKIKYYSLFTMDTPVTPDMKVFKHDIADKSGRHTHQGGFGILGLRGEGETLVDGERVQWGAGDLVVLPFKPGGVEHQHFNRNDPDNPATWLALNYQPYLEHVGALFRQEEDSKHWEGDGHGDHDHDTDDVSEFMADFDYGDWLDYDPPDENDLETIYDDMMRRRNLDRRRMARAQEAGNWALIRDDQLEWEINPQGKMKWYTYPGHDDRSMKALIISMQEIPPGSYSGKQLRQGMQVHYVLEGSGHSVIDGERYEWQAGDFLGLPVQKDGHTVQHFNDDPENPARFVRAEPNVHEAVGYDLGCGWEQLESCPEHGG